MAKFLKIKDVEVTPATPEQLDIMEQQRKADFARIHGYTEDNATPVHAEVTTNKHREEDDFTPNQEIEIALLQLENAYMAFSSLIADIKNGEIEDALIDLYEPIALTRKLLSEVVSFEFGDPMQEHADYEEQKRLWRIELEEYRAKEQEKLDLYDKASKDRQEKFDDRV
jgi:hypothetical protein